MNKTASFVIALASVVIALNMTYSNFHTADQKPPENMEERVLPVVGRAWTTFDGMGATVGFLVKDGENFKIVPYDSGSMADNPAFLPKYVTTVRYANGQTLVHAITVDTIH
jgi:hypothetical protein